MDPSLYPMIRPQQPLRPAWMGDFEHNERWEVIQGDALVYFIELFCGCPMIPDITNWTFLFTVKASMDPSDPNDLAQVIWNEQHGACGYTALIVLPYQTSVLPAGSFAFDLKYRTPSTALVQTIRRGELDILPSTNTDLSPLGEIPPPIVGPPYNVLVQNAFARQAS
jgi:hypothetical protein